MRSKQLLISGLLLSCSLGVPAASEEDVDAQVSKECPEILNHSFNKLNSSEKVAMCQQFKGEVLLIVNTASQCGFTPQYKQLEKVYQKYKADGFSVVGFPSNDFKQDRGTEADTAKVCYLDYGVTFPMIERTSIKGEAVNPVFQSLAHETGVVPQWNFFKYVIDRKGDVVGVFSSRIEPTDDTIIDMIEKQL